MTTLASRKSPTSPNPNTRPSNPSLTRPGSRPQTPLGLRDYSNSTSGSPPLEPPSGLAYRAFISTWTDGHVAQWLTEAKCAKVIPLFHANHIKGDVVLDLDQGILKDMGIVSVGDRIKIMTAVKALRNRCTQSKLLAANGLTAGPRLMFTNDQKATPGSPLAYTNGRAAGSEMPRSPSFPSTTVMPGSPTILDTSPPNNNRISGGTGRRSDRPPPLHLPHTTQKDLPQIISGNLNTPNLPPTSAKSALTPRPNQSQHTPSTGGSSGARERDPSSSSRQNYPGLPPPPRVQPPNPPPGSSSHVAVSSGPTSSRSNRGLYPTHGREHSGSNVAYAEPPQSGISAIAPWTGEYGLPRGPGPGNLQGGSYAQSGRASPQPHSRTATGRSTNDAPLSHKKSGSLSGAVGGLIAGLKGSGWQSGSHPYADESQHATHATPVASNNAGYSVGRGPYQRPGHHQQGSMGAAFTLDDLRRRTIKFSIGESGSTKHSRTIDISDCETGVQILHAALKKFGKLLSHNDRDGQDYTEAEGGGLIVDGWGVFLDGIVPDAHGQFSHHPKDVYID